MPPWGVPRFKRSFADPAVLPNPPDSAHKVLYRRDPVNCRDLTERMGLLDYFEPHVWALLFALLGVAAVPFFVPPSVGLAAGLATEQYILVVGAVELSAALGIAAVVISHRDPDSATDDGDDWKYDP
jgi:hypothetical protein